MRVAFLAWTSLFCCLSLPGPAQQTASSPQAPSPPHARPLAHEPDRRIVLDVVVTDKAGKPVSGLHQQDFSILDDKQPQPISSFRAANDASTPADPVQVILLVDAVNTAFRGLGYERQGLTKSLQRDGGRLALPTSLVILEDTSTQVEPVPTRDGRTLADALNSNNSGLRVIGRSQGFYGAADRMQISLDTLERLASYEAKQLGRKLLIWLSPGWPMLTGPNIELTAKNQETLFNMIVGLSTEVRQARITLYSIDPLGVADADSFQTFYYEEFLKGVASAKQVQNGDLGLQVLATQSGGRVLNSSNDVAGLIATCLADAKAYYTLSFDSPEADHPNEYHSLTVKIGKPGLTARTRTGYYAQP